jgi:hypothetical protein
MEDILLFPGKEYARHNFMFGNGLVRMDGHERTSDRAAKIHLCFCRWEIKGRIHQIQGTQAI